VEVEPDREDESEGTAMAEDGRARLRLKTRARGEDEGMRFNFLGSWRVPASGAGDQLRPRELASSGLGSKHARG